MKKKIRKILFVVLGVITVTLTIIVVTFFITGKWSFEVDDGRLWLVVDYTNGEDDTYSQIIKASKTTYPTDIFVYGEDCNFRKEVEFTEITELTDEQLKSDKEYKFIIINDLSGKLEITDEEFDLIHRYVYEEKYHLVYLGINQYSNLVENELCMKDSNLGNVNGFAVDFIGETPIFSSGIWDEEGHGYYENGNTELLGEVIFLHLRNVYRGL